MPGCVQALSASSRRRLTEGRCPNRTFEACQRLQAAEVQRMLAVSNAAAKTTPAVLARWGARRRQSIWPRVSSLKVTPMRSWEL